MRLVAVVNMFSKYQVPGWLETQAAIVLSNWEELEKWRITVSD